VGREEWGMRPDGLFVSRFPETRSLRGWGMRRDEQFAWREEQLMRREGWGTRLAFFEN
jgi:hypothetical protein